MSYEEKYLKYKSKYLALKTLKNNLEQLGGSKINTKSIYEDSFFNLTSLSDTPIRAQEGGKKHNKKSFWEDSNIDLNSSTDSLSMSDFSGMSSTDSDKSGKKSVLVSIKV